MIKGMTDFCFLHQTVKETIGVGVNEKAALSSDKNCPFVYINFDCFLNSLIAQKEIYDIHPTK